MSCFVAFHYRSYGTFFYTKIGSIISIGDLPTTNIIEPKGKGVGLQPTPLYVFLVEGVESRIIQPIETTTLHHCF